MSLYDSVVITGGAGMLAQALASALRARGLKPHMVARAECDISQRPQVVALFGRLRPSLILNCAAHTKVDLCEEDVANAYAINADGPGHLAELSSEFGSHLAHFSTDFVFDGQSDRPYLTIDPASPLSVYGSSKLSGENRVRAALPNASTVIRTAWLYGRHGHCFPTTILKAARAGRPLTVVNDQIGTPTFAEDLAAVTLALIDRRASGLFHVTGSGQTTWYEFAKRLLEVFDVKAELKPISTADWTAMRPKQAKRPVFSVLDCSGTEELLGQRMSAWPDALMRFRDGMATEQPPVIMSA